MSHCEKAPQSHTKLKPHKPVTSTVSNFIRSYTAMRLKKYPQRNIVMTGKECKLCWQSSFPGKQPYKCSRDVLPERLKGRIGEITNILGIFVLSTYHTTSLLMVLAHHSCNILNLKLGTHSLQTLLLLEQGCSKSTLIRDHLSNSNTKTTVNYCKASPILD